ncbi:MAG: hypothetical protein GY913_32980 [Proteobacteria bacterium]|nr:hypothetical protein [Pseudomonadota bacterium]MCP4921739.1 hypothetical protein [Pseudomonadota bacterium]
MTLLAFLSTSEARPLEDSTLTLEAMTLAMPGDATGGFGAAVRGDRNGYLRVDSRSQATGDWIARGTIGVDCFGGWDFFDLNVGASLAGAGDWRDRAVYGQLGAGVEVGVGFNVRRVHLTAHRVQPFASSPVMYGLDESAVRLAYDVTDELTLFGTSLRIKPDFENDVREQTYGLGASWTF